MAKFPSIVCNGFLTENIVKNNMQILKPCDIDITNDAIIVTVFSTYYKNQIIDSYTIKLSTVEIGELRKLKIRFMFVNVPIETFTISDGTKQISFAKFDKLFGMEVAKPSDMSSLEDIILAIKAGKQEHEAYRKEHEDELFYKECAKNNILTTNTADAARMKIIAKQLGISYSDDELIQKFLKGMSVTKEMERIAEENERQARFPVIRKEELLAEQESKKYINLTGSDKRIRMCLDEAARYRAEVAQYEQIDESIANGAATLYSLYSEKETDWAIHGGVASALAGSAAGVAVAADIQRKNAEVRASNEQLRQSVDQFSVQQRLNIWMKQHEVEKIMKRYETDAEKAKLKLVDFRPQEDLLRLLCPVIEKKETSETGAITFTVRVNKASITIYDTVSAVVDGSFKVKVMDGKEVAGEAYFTLPYNGSERNSTLSGICASLPAAEKEYTFVFEPHNLFAIEL